MANDDSLRIPSFDERSAGAERENDAAARLASLVEQAPDGIFIADLDGRYTEVNGAGCRMTGYRRDEIVGRRIVDLIHPEDAPRLWAERERLLDGKPLVTEWRLRRKDGTDVPVEISANILPDGRWQAFVRDIGERKRVEAALRASEERLALVLEASGQGWWDWDLVRDEARMSRSYWALLECDEPEEHVIHASSTFFREMIHPDDRDRVFADVEANFLGKAERSNIEYRARKKSGGYVWLHGMGRVMERDERGTPRRMIGVVEDISHTKRLREEAEVARRQLAESEERFRLAFEEAPIGIALVALDGRFVRVNQALCEIAGYGADELTELTFQAITHPDDLDADLRLAEKLYRGEFARYHLPKRYIRKDGTIVDVMLSASVLRARSGEPLYYIAQIEDNTERKRAEEALRVSEAKFSGLISVAADAIVAVDQNERITIYNEGARRIFGWAPEEILGKQLDILIPQRFRAIHHQHVHDFGAEPTRTRQMGKPRNVFGLRKDGEEFCLEAAISSLSLEGEKLLMIVARDVTERVRTERELRFLTEFSGALASSLDPQETLATIARLAVRSFTGCCAVDLVGETGSPERLLVAHADPTKAEACRVLERTRPPPASTPSVIENVIASRQPFIMSRVPEGYFETMAHDPRHLQAMREIGASSFIVVPMVARERVLGTLTFATTPPSRPHDEADLHLAEELAGRAALALENARLYEVARKAIEVRDDVLGIVAHDLRNPVSAILMQLDAVGRHDDPDSHAQTVARIRRAAKRMDRLIQDLLDVTRVEAGHLTIEPTRVDADAVVRECVEDQRAAASASSLDLRHEIAGALPLVWANRDRLLQVLSNLIGNAIKFTPRDGQVTVGARPRDGEVLFWVTDTGHGISPEDLPYVFDRFWQARRGERRGAGLGLPIVKGIVEAHGGRIWAQSAPGQGSTFFFTIPASPRTELRPAEPAPGGR